MRVFVTGGTGAIGRPAVRALIRDGHEVTALARSADKAAWLRDQGAVPVEGSIFDAEELRGLFEGHDAIANLATALPSTFSFAFPWAWRDNQRIRTEGSAAVVDAALAAEVPHLVQESVCMLYPDGGDGWIDETTPPDHFPAADGNLAAEMSAQRFTDSGGTGVVLRLGWFYGPGATHSEEFFALARRHLCVQIGGPDGYLSSIHVDDGGDAVSAALGAQAGIYNVVDDEPLPRRAYADALADAAGKRPWLRLPGRAARLMGSATTGLTRSLRVSNRKFRDETSWAPTYPERPRRLAGDGRGSLGIRLTERPSALLFGSVERSRSVPLPAAGGADRESGRPSARGRRRASPHRARSRRPSRWIRAG